MDNDAIPGSESKVLFFVFNGRLQLHASTFPPGTSMHQCHHNHE